MIDPTKIPAKRILTDEQFERIRALPPEVFAKLPPNLKRAFFSTSAYFLGQRQAIQSLEGITIGNAHIEDILTRPDLEE